MKDRLDKLEKLVRSCGEYARAQQNLIHRTYKSDGTVLTETDLEVTRRILGFLKKEFPDCNIVTEELDIKGFDADAPYTFVLDPIDGTDSYSQGQAPWCVSLGILDKDRIPAGAMICAPRFGKGCDEMFLRTDPCSDDVFLNGSLLDVSFIKAGNKDVPKEITVGSGVVSQIPFHRIGCHFRSYGCAIIHIASAVVFSGIDGCVSPVCYVWDIAAAHAVARKAGMDFQYWTGEPFVYDDNLIINRKKFPKPIVVGTPLFRDEMIRRLNTQEA